MIFSVRNGCPTSKEEASTVRALLAPPVTVRRPEGLLQWFRPLQFLSPHLPMHESYTTRCGKATHIGWNCWVVALSQVYRIPQWFPYRLVYLSCDPSKFIWKAELEYGSSLGRKKPTLEHDSSSPLEAQAPNFSKETFIYIWWSAHQLFSLSLYGSPHRSGL